MTADEQDRSSSDSAAISYFGILSEDDFHAFYRMATRMQAGSNVVDYALGAGVFFFGAGVYGVFAGRDPENVILWFVLGGLGLSGWWLTRNSARKMWSEGAGFHQPYRGRVSDVSLETRVSDVNATIPWTTITAYAQDEQVVVLRTDDQTLIPLSRGFFESDEEWDRVEKIIREKVAGNELSSRTFGYSVLLFLAAIMLIFLLWLASTSIQK